MWTRHRAALKVAAASVISVAAIVTGMIGMTSGGPIGVWSFCLGLASIAAWYVCD